MAKENTNIYLDAELKKQCQELFDDLGMDLTTAITIFLKQCLRVQGLPFPVSREDVNPDASVVDSISGILAGKVSEDIDSHSLREDKLKKYTIDD